MRSKVIATLGAIAIAFLLATNPVIADAAKQITGKQIKNNTVTTKDIKNSNLTTNDIKNNNLTGNDVKNGSLTEADLNLANVPLIQQLSRLSASPFSTLPANDPTLAFQGPTTTVSVDGGDSIVATGTVVITANANGDEVFVAMCSRPVGDITTPTVLGAESFGIGLNADDNQVPVAGSATLPAGNHTVGVCIGADAAAMTMTLKTVDVWMQVIDGLPALAKSTGKAPKPTRD